MRLSNNKGQTISKKWFVDFNIAPPFKKQMGALLLFSFLFGIIILIFLRDFIFLGGTWNEGDYGVQHYPWAKFYAEQLKQFRLPLWCDFNHCGFPLFAEGQVGAIYPINLLLFFALPFKWAYNGSIVLHFFLAGFCMFVFLRFLKCSFVSGFIGALVWVFGSAFAGAEYNLMALRTLTWFPLALFLIELHLKADDADYGRKALFLLLLAILYFFQWTAGSIQFACYAIFFSSLYFLIRVTSVILSERSERRIPLIPLFKSLVLYLLSIGFSFGLSAAQILPTLELTRETLRLGHANLEFSLSGSFSPLALFSMVFPRATSSISGWKIYVGIFPLFLFCLLFLRKKIDAKADRFYLNLFIGLALLTLFLAFGKFNPLYPEMVKFFHLYFFRSPGKFTIFTSFFLSVLTAYGFELFLRILEKEDSPIIRSVRKIFGGLLSISLVIFCVSSFVIHLFPNFWMDMGRAYVRRYIYQKGYHLLSLEEYYHKVGTHYEALKEAFSFNAYNILSIGLILFVLLILFRGARRLRTPAVKYLAIIFIILDLFIFHFYGTGFKGNISSFQKKADLEGFNLFRHDSDYFRVYLYAKDAGSLEKLGIPPNANMLYGVSYAGAYSPLITKRYSEYFKELGNSDDSLGFVFTKEETFSKNLSRLSLANVKYIYSAEKMVHSDLSLIGQTQAGNYLYLNQQVLPRAFFMKNVHFLPKQKSVNLDLSEEYFPLKIVEYSHGKRQIFSKENRDGWLFLSSLWYPGWHATVDGGEVEIYRASDLFQAIPLKRGEHKIVFLYQPESLRWGAAISLMTLFAIALLSLFLGLSLGLFRIFPLDRSSLF